MRTRIAILTLAAGLFGCATPPTSRPDSTPYPVTRIDPRVGHLSGSSAAPPANPPSQPAPQPQAIVHPTPPSAPPRPTPSLEQERDAQAARAAAALSKKNNVPFERVDGPAPTWWPRGSAGGDGLGTAKAATLEDAYKHAAQQAIQQPATGRPAPVRMAGYSRIPTGEFVVWVSTTGAGLKPSAAPAPSGPSVAPAATPTGPDVPTWFSTKAREENGRVFVGALADAPSLREAPRMASEAGKAALADVIGAEPKDFRLESTYVKQEGNGYRAYVLISCAGTIKK